MTTPRVPGTFAFPRNQEKVSLGSYAIVDGYVGDHRDLVWGSMIYACTDKPTGPTSVPPDWDRIVENAPEGYWDERGGPPEITVDSDGRRWFPPKPGGCGHTTRYYLGVGVEGPPELRERNAFIPCPFVAGSCPKCGLPMSHVRWNEDETFEEPYGTAPAGIRYFRVPDESLQRRNAEQGYSGAELVQP